jgi:hypothetical protein
MHRILYTIIEKKEEAILIIFENPKISKKVNQDQK